jgi:hypothetical protein
MNVLLLGVSTDAQGTAAAGSWKTFSVNAPWVGASTDAQGAAVATSLDSSQ